MADSTANARASKPKRAAGVSGKPAKPHKDFPLYAHATRRWAKRIRGKIHYFGPWDDPDVALAKWLDQKDDLLAGRTPRVSGEGVTVRELVNKFLTSKKRLVESKELSARSWRDYYYTCERLLGEFGKTRLVVDLTTSDFEKLRSTLAERLGPTALGNEVQRVRTLFKYALDEGLVDRPIRYGQSFKKPSRKTLRLVRAAVGSRMFAPEEIRKLIAKTNAPLGAMILLAINVGHGQSDVSGLPLSALDLETRWIDYPRSKTGIARRAKLWSETVAAIKAAIAERPAPRDTGADGDCVFLTKYGRRWTRTYGEGTPDDAVGKEFAKLLVNLDMKRAGRSFYSLRRTFRTVADSCLDRVAIDLVMGHCDDSMGARYRETVADSRLEAVADHVHRWLFGNTKANGKGGAKAKRKAKAK